MHQTSFGERIAYGLGDLASNCSNAIINFFMLYYYTNVIHIPAGIVGTILMAVMLADSVFDVVMGIAVDKTHTRFGKARPWIIRMCLPHTIALILLFSVPDVSMGGKVLYASVTYLLFNMIYSSVNIPYGILNSLITYDQYERSVVNIFRTIMAYGTLILISLVTLHLVDSLGSGRIGWQLTAVIYAAVAMCAFLLTFFFTRERPVSHIRPQSGVPFRQGLRALVKNRYWIILVCFAIVLYVMFSIVNGVTVYYTKFILHNGNLLGILTVGFYVPIVVGMFFIAPFIRRFGKCRLSIAGLLLAAFGSLCMLPVSHSAAAIFVGNVIRGLGMMPVLGTFWAMVSDTIEYGHWKTGVRTEGLVYSASSFGIKMGVGLGSAIMGWTLSLSGFTGGSALTPHAASAVWLLYLLLPVFLLAAMVFILLFYRLDQLYPTVVMELAKGQEAQPPEISG